MLAFQDRNLLLFSYIRVFCRTFFILRYAPWRHAWGAFHKKICFYFTTRLSISSEIITTWMAKYRIRNKFAWPLVVFLKKSRHFRSRNANSERGEMTKLRMLELKILHSIIIVGLFSFPLREHWLNRDLRRETPFEQRVRGNGPRDTGRDPWKRGAFSSKSLPKKSRNIQSSVLL